MSLRRVVFLFSWVFLRKRNSMGWRNIFLRQQILDLQKCKKRFRFRDERGNILGVELGEGDSGGWIDLPGGLQVVRACSKNISNRGTGWD